MARRLVAKFYRAQDVTESINEFIKEHKAPIQLAVDRQIDRVNSLDEVGTDTKALRLFLSLPFIFGARLVRALDVTSQSSQFREYEHSP